MGSGAITTGSVSAAGELDVFVGGGIELISIVGGDFAPGANTGGGGISPIITGPLTPVDTVVPSVKMVVGTVLESGGGSGGAGEVGRGGGILAGVVATNLAPSGSCGAGLLGGGVDRGRDG